MEEVRQLVQEEGREARNLVAFHVTVDNPGRISRKPPRALPPARRIAPRPPSRLRSASAGRDKRSELRARYWALLFGDLQRAVGEIYNTVEAHENLSECQEVILVLENYTRDFKALCEWFRLKWEYDNTPPPQRPQSLAWEIRKTDFVRPESRKAYSVKSSPTVSGKNSPCLSGHNTPSGKNSPNLLTGKISPGSGKISPRVSSGHSSTSPKANIEFFSNKISASKITAKPEPTIAKEMNRLSDIKEKVVFDDKTNTLLSKASDLVTIENMDHEISIPVAKADKVNDISNITSHSAMNKSSPKHAKPGTKNKESILEISNQAKETIEKLNIMECTFLEKQLIENAKKYDNMVNQDRVNDMKLQETEIKVELNGENPTPKSFEVVNIKKSSESPTKFEDNFADVSNESTSNDDKINFSPIDDKFNTDSKTVPSNCNKLPKSTAADNTSTKNNNTSDNKATPDNSASENFEQIKIDPSKEEESKETPKKDTDQKKIDPKQLDPKLSTRPAYSQAAAKPKVFTGKIENKPPVKTNPIIRSKTVVEIRQSAAPKVPKQFPKRNQTSKCSYPFNLTTGRTSLFDNTSSNTSSNTNRPGIRKAPNKIIQLGAGDSKTKVEPKKLPLKRPSSLKINEKGDKKDKEVPHLQKRNECEEYSSSDTLVTQIDMSRIESSESLKTLVPDDLLGLDSANSVEVLNIDGIKNDNDGWLTVKSRRLSRESKKHPKSHWSNRFHQPSATTSLPTLNMMESPKREPKSITEIAKFDRAKSEQPQNIQQESEKNVKLNGNSKSREKARNTSMIRQKSDVTGLRTRSVRNKAMSKKAERMKDNLKTIEGSDLTKNRLHSSLESLTGLSRSQESTEGQFDFDKWKAEFKSYFKYYDDDDQISNHNEILKTADPSEMSEIAEMTSQIEENERKISLALDFQSEYDQRKLCEEEDLLNRQIMELQQVSDVDIDTETDDTETDAEILCEDRPNVPSSPDTLGPLSTSLEDQYETALAGMSWAERVDTLVVLEALVARDPGRAQQLHAKLSQGIKRRGSFQDALRRLQAKQARAEQHRLELQTERTKRIHTLLTRVEEVKVAKNQLIEEKRLRMERRLQKAAENRDQHLKHIVRKAHDEEEKLREIAFIKQLEAENRRHDFLEQCRTHNTRLRSMRRDRLHKLEQKAAREAAVGARRLALEEARRLHVETLLEKRKERDARVEELKEQKRQERDDAAREKAEGVKSRLSALAAAAELEADALRSRIRDKQESSQIRLATHLQAIRIKATGPRLATTSESQDPASKEEEEIELQNQQKKEKERQKAIKKRARKLRQKLMACGQEFEDEECHHEVGHLPPMFSTTKICKLLTQINNTVSAIIPNERKTKDINQNGIDDNRNKNKSDETKVNGDTAPIEKKKSRRNKKASSEEKQIVKPEEPTADIKTLDESQVTNNNEDLPTNDNDAKPAASKKSKAKKKAAKKEQGEGVDNNKTNAAKLSKTSSAASSMSDMSRANHKNEGRVVNVDWMHLEKVLNELNRIMEKIDKSAQDMLLHGLKILSQLLYVAVDREETGIQVTTKSLATTVQIVSRVVSSCTASAAYFINTNGCVHIAKLLSVQMEKDLDADKHELNLAKQLADCLSITLDSVLCATRLYDEDHEVAPDHIEGLAAVRKRAHMLISYICLSGCVTKAEHNSSSAREGIQTLLTVCSDLCHPNNVDTGQERQAALNCLKTSLGANLCGSRSELCQLFCCGAVIQNNNGTPQCGEFVKAARTAHLLRALASLDHGIVQEAFGEGRWPLEFRAAVARLLTQHAPTDKEAPRNSHRTSQRLDQMLSETVVLDLIMLVGFVVVNNPQHLATICDGWPAVKTLCTLPAHWLVSKPHSLVLLPTLAALAQHPPAAAVIGAELNLEMIEEFINTPDAQIMKLVQVIQEGRKCKQSKK